MPPVQPKVQNTEKFTEVDRVEALEVVLVVTKHDSERGPRYTFCAQKEYYPPGKNEAAVTKYMNPRHIADLRRALDKLEAKFKALGAL